jgi:hypothetical protein
MSGAKSRRNIGPLGAWLIYLLSRGSKAGATPAGVGKGEFDVVGHDSAGSGLPFRSSHPPPRAF